MLADDVAAALPRLRAEASARMSTTVRVESVTVATGPTGADVETPTIIHAAIRCRVKSANRQARPGHADGSLVVQVSDEVHFPWDTLGLVAGLRVTVTALGPLDPPSMLGGVYRLSNPHEGSQHTAQRWGVESWAGQMS